MFTMFCYPYPQLQQAHYIIFIWWQWWYVYTVYTGWLWRHSVYNIKLLPCCIYAILQKHNVVVIPIPADSCVELYTCQNAWFINDAGIAFFSNFRIYLTFFHITSNMAAWFCSEWRVQWCHFTPYNIKFVCGDGQLSAFESLLFRKWIHLVNWILFSQRLPYESAVWCILHCSYRQCFEVLKLLMNLASARSKWTSCKWGRKLELPVSNRSSNTGECYTVGISVSNLHSGNSWKYGPYWYQWHS